MSADHPDRQPNARDEMDRVVMTLALELPAAVWFDLNAKWNAVRPLVATPTRGEPT